MVKAGPVEIALDQWVVQGEGSIASDMDGERVLLSVRNGKYYNLGEIGGVIWDQMTAPVMVARIIDRLLDAFEVERAVCEAQTLAFLGSMLSEGLIIQVLDAAHSA